MLQSALEHCVGSGDDVCASYDCIRVDWEGCLRACQQFGRDGNDILKVVSAGGAMDRFIRKHGRAALEGRLLCLLCRCHGKFITVQNTEADRYALVRLNNMVLQQRIPSLTELLY
jgi:hypothetical protein